MTYDQLSRTILPSRFGKGLLEQAELGAAGEKLSTMSWALFSQGSDKPVKIRSVRTRDKDGTVRRMLRSQHSQTFAEYDNLRFVEDLLSNAPELAAMAVLDFKVTDTLMRLRFCTEDVGIVRCCQTSLHHACCCPLDVRLFEHVELLGDERGGIS